MSEPGQPLTMTGTVERSDFCLDLEVRVEPGEVLGVLGPNGAGKTTLLRALAGLEPLSSGRIRIGSRVLDDTASGVFVPPEHRPVGLVFQSYRLFPHLDVRDNIAFAPRAAGASRREARGVADGWLERFDLVGLAGRRPDKISGGQAQRVALARALAADPGYLLLDEPLSALDAQTRLDVRTELRRHLEEFAGPVLVITHDPLEAMVMADRLLVLEGGRVVQRGTPAEVAGRPLTQYVARMVGLNLYPGTLHAGSATVELAGGGALTVGGDGADTMAGSAADTMSANGHAGRHVLVALRPSAITIHITRPEQSSSRNVWQGRVAGLELVADRVRVQVDGTPPALVDVTAQAVADLSLRPGSVVWLSAKATETDAYPDPGA